MRTKLLIFVAALFAAQPIWSKPRIKRSRRSCSSVLRTVKNATCSIASAACGGFLASLGLYALAGTIDSAGQATNAVKSFYNRTKNTYMTTTGLNEGEATGFALAKTTLTEVPTHIINVAVGITITALLGYYSFKALRASYRAMSRVLNPQELEEKQNSDESIVIVTDDDATPHITIHVS